MQPDEAIRYRVAQFLGAIVGALVLWLVLSDTDGYSRTCKASAPTATAVIRRAGGAGLPVSVRE
jgi:glycerol uptake facilitator-like aquaporin